MTQITSFLERFAERQSSFILFSDRVYDIIDKPGYPNTIITNNFLQSLVPSMPFSHFESLDYHTQLPLIEELTQSYLKSTLDKEVKNETQIKKELIRIKTLEYIMYELLPFLVSKKYNNDDQLIDLLNAATNEAEEVRENPQERARKEIYAKLSQDFFIKEGTEIDHTSEVKQRIIAKERTLINNQSLIETTYSPSDLNLTEQDFVPSKDFLPSILGEIIGHQPLYILDGRVFNLTLNQTQAISDIKIDINGQTFYPKKEVSSIHKLSQELLTRRTKLWQLAALESSKDIFELIAQNIKNDDIKEKQMRELVKLNEYSIYGNGFIYKNDQYYVYTTIPKFATQDARKSDRFWPYNALRLSITVGWENNKPYSLDKPRVIEDDLTLPILYHRTTKGGYHEICNLTRSPSDYKNTPLDMVRKLSDAANALTKPLTQESLDQHPGESYFGVTLKEILTQQPLTREEAMVQGYQIYEVVARTVGEEK